MRGRRVAAFSWDRENRIAADYASQRLGHLRRQADPGEFGAIWAHMARGFHLGELRDLPSLEDAFDDWLLESSVPQRLHVAVDSPRWTGVCPRTS